MTFFLRNNWCCLNINSAIMYQYWVLRQSNYLAELLLYKSQVGFENVRASNVHVSFAYKTQVSCKNAIFSFDSIFQFHFRGVTEFAGLLPKESLKKTTLDFGRTNHILIRPLSSVDWLTEITNLPVKLSDWLDIITKLS